MQLHREWLMDDLANLQTDRKAIQNIQKDIKSLESEYTVLKATCYDKVPGNSCGNSQLDKMELNLAKREELNLCLNGTIEHVKYMEDLLGQLDRNERELIEKTIVLHSATNEKIAEQLGVDPRTIYRKKSEVIGKLLRLRFGRGYRP